MLKNVQTERVTVSLRTRRYKRMAQPSAFFEDSQVDFFVRRLMEQAHRLLIDGLYTVQKLAADNGCDVVALWRQRLPAIQQVGTYWQHKNAEDIVREVRDIEHIAEYVYMKYCRLTFRRDAMGNFNRIEITDVPFYELFHAFLTRLTASEAVRSLAVFADVAKFEYVSRGALRDALYDVSAGSGRVRLLEQLTPAALASQLRRNSPGGAGSATGPGPGVSLVTARAHGGAAIAAPPMAVSPHDSASQVHSLGMRHQNAIMSALAGGMPAGGGGAARAAGDDAAAAGGIAQGFADRRRKRSKSRDRDRDRDRERDRDHDEDRDRERDRERDRDVDRHRDGGGDGHRGHSRNIDDTQDVQMAAALPPLPPLPPPIAKQLPRIVTIEQKKPQGSSQVSRSGGSRVSRGSRGSRAARAPEVQVVVERGDATGASAGAVDGVA